MRTAFIETLERMAAANERLILVTGDLGFSVFDSFRARFPSQFYNVGVAEQNLAGVAAGLALSGHTVLTYSIGNFPTLRCLEQIRNDICYHGADVKIVTVGGGMAYGALGFSHFATEDLAIMRALPGLMVVAPGDPFEVESLLPQVVAHKGPVYLRLGRAGEKRQHRPGTEVSLGRPTVAREGADVLLLTFGGMLPVALAAAEQLSEEGTEAQVVSVHTLKPLDDDAIVSMVSRFPAVVTCEEHSILGGGGGAIAEVIAEASLSVTFRRFGLESAFPVGVGSQEFLRDLNGIGVNALVSLVRSLQRESARTSGPYRD